jgi:hypothetical protein
MGETYLVPTSLVAGSEVGNDKIADVKPEILDNFYYFHNLVFKVS